MTKLRVVYSVAHFEQFVLCMLGSSLHQQMETTTMVKITVMLTHQSQFKGVTVCCGNHWVYPLEQFYPLHTLGKMYTETHRP